MQLISFFSFGIITVTFAVLYFVNKLSVTEKRSVIASNVVLLAASYLFITFIDYRFTLIIALITLITWCLSKKKSLYAWGILIVLIALGFFKYTNFFAESFAKLIGNDYTALNIILPVGISFYTFSAVSYLADLKRERIDPVDLIELSLYLSYFPKLISGPIVKSKQFFEMLSEKRDVGWMSFSRGIQIFVFGLLKKIVIADRLSVFVDQVYQTPQAFGSLTVFFAVIAYSFQIYFDFSGYSDMAIGISELFGIKLPRNFNLPYLSHNVTELWKRWHITLSEWLQDYLYISLGGNRKGKIRTYLNLVLTMVIGGIWHGANWTYVVWGALHGIALAVHKMWMNFTGSRNKKHSTFSNCLSIFLTFMFTTFCWIFFRAPDIGSAFLIIKRIFSFDTGLEQPYLWLFVAAIILVCASAVALIRSAKYKTSVKKYNICFADGFYPVMDLTKFWNLVIFFTVCGMVLCFAYTGGSPFIYGNY